MDMSLEYINVARENLELANYNVVMICAYTAMFHAARSVLFRDGVKERSHVCIGIYIRGKYGKNPIVSQLMTTFDNYRLERHATLYSLDSQQAYDDAERALSDSIKFRNGILNFLDD